MVFMISTVEGLKGICSTTASLCPVYIFLLPKLGLEQDHMPYSKVSRSACGQCLLKKGAGVLRERELVLYDIIAVTDNDLPQGSLGSTFQETVSSFLLSTYLMDTGDQGRDHWPDI